MVHRIDADDRLIGFDDAFRRFAEANGEPGLCDEWLGRSLWEAIASAEINTVFRSLVERARRGRTITVPSRCDAPGLARCVDITLVPGPRGEVAFLSRVTAARFDAPVTSDELLRMCAWCLRIESDGWRGAEEVVAQHGLLLGQLVPEITHGICPDCMTVQLERIDTPA